MRPGLESARRAICGHGSAACSLNWSCSHGGTGGTGCVCAAAVICRARNRDIAAFAMQEFERMFIDRKSK